MWFEPTLQVPNAVATLATPLAIFNQDVAVKMIGRDLARQTKPPPKPWDPRLDGLSDSQKVDRRCRSMSYKFRHRRRAANTDASVKFISRAARGLECAGRRATKES